MSDRIVMLTVNGTHYEQGLQQGKILKEEIMHNIGLAKHLVEPVVQNKSYKKFISENLKYLADQFPDLVEEMHGIADGSNISFESIAMLNIPAYFFSERFSPECSMILAKGKATEDGKTYVIKNRDMRASIRQVLLQRKYPNGQMISEVTGIGTVTYPASGINSNGLGVTTTGFWSTKVIPTLSLAANSQIFFNIHILLKQCSSVDESLSLLRKFPVMNGLNLILTDRNKSCIVEMTSNGMVIEWDTGAGILFRTNHYVSDKFCSLNPDREEYPSTFMRYERIESLLKQSYGHIRFQDLYRVLSDHENGINGICRHPQENITARTVSTTLFILEDQEIWTTLDNPCLAIPHVSIKEKKEKCNVSR